MKTINTLLITAISAFPYADFNKLGNEQQPQTNDNQFSDTAASNGKGLALSLDNNGQIQETPWDSTGYSGPKFQTIKPGEEEPKYYAGLLLPPNWDNQGSDLSSLDFPKVEDENLPNDENPLPEYLSPVDNRQKNPTFPLGYMTV